MITPRQLEHIRKDAERGQVDAQFLLSQICTQNQDFDQMIHWLTEASARGHADAQGALAFAYEKGQGVTKNYTRALDYYGQAIANGSAAGCYHKAELLYKSDGAEKNQALIQQLLSSSVASDNAPVAALRTVGFLAMQSLSTRPLAITSLTMAASKGDPVSCFNLGWLLSRGNEPAMSLAAYWLDQAAAKNYPLAQNYINSMGLQSITKKEPLENPGSLSSNIGDTLALWPQKIDFHSKTIHGTPAINLIHDVLAIPDCAYLMYLSLPTLRRADVINPEGDRRGVSSEVRTNMSTFLPFSRVDVIARYIELKIMQATNAELSKSEPMSILFYAKNQYYRPHVDYFDPALTASKSLLEDGGQRVSSAVTYLQAPLLGGGTSFPRLKLEVPASQGDTLLFDNVLGNGQPDRNSLHAGDPVESGEKWVVTKWFRQSATGYMEH